MGTRLQNSSSPNNKRSREGSQDLRHLNCDTKMKVWCFLFVLLAAVLYTAQAEDNKIEPDEFIDDIEGEEDLDAYIASGMVDPGLPNRRWVRVRVPVRVRVG